MGEERFLRMKNNIEININSLFCKVLINYVYLLGGIIVVAFIAFTIFLFQQFEHKFTCLIFISIVLCCVMEKYRQNTEFNRYLISSVERFVYDLSKEPFRITNFLDKTLNLFIGLLFIYQVILLLQKPIILNTSRHQIFDAVGIVITVSSIVLTVLFTTLQQFQNKYSDFISIIHKWKNTNIFLFIMLALYTTSSFIIYVKGSNANIDILILIASIYLVLKLIIIAINISFMMNFEIIIKAYDNDIIEFINCLNIDPNSNNLIKELTKKGFKNFVKYKIWGINKRKCYTLDEKAIDELKRKVEPIFRLAEKFLRENNLNNFMHCNDAIIRISHVYAPLANIFFETKIYNFMAAKIKELFKLSIKLDYQSFPEHLVKLNERLGLNSIREKNEDSLFRTPQGIGFSAFKDNAKEFVIMAINLENSTAPCDSIISLKRFTRNLIFNNSLDEAQAVIEDLNLLVLAIWTFNNTKQVKNNDWCIRLIRLIIIDFINAFYDIVCYRMNERMGYDTSTFEGIVKKVFNNSLEILSKYKTYTSDFTTFFYNAEADINLITLTKLLEETPFIKTPYLNSRLKGSPLKTVDITALDQVYNAIFVSDFRDNIHIEDGLRSLYNMLDIFVESTEILNKSGYTPSVKSIMEALTNIQRYLFLFIKRVNATDYKKKMLLNLAKSFLEKLYQTYLTILVSCLYSENNYSYQENFVEFVKVAIKMYLTDDIRIQEIVKTFIQDIINHYEKLEERQQKSLYKELNLIALLMSQAAVDSELFEILCDFVLKFIPEENRNHSFYPDIWEENNLPSFAKYWVDQEQINSYSNILANKQETILMDINNILCYCIFSLHTNFNI